MQKTSSEISWCYISRYFIWILYL